MTLADLNDFWTKIQPFCNKPIDGKYYTKITNPKVIQLLEEGGFDLNNLNLDQGSKAMEYLKQFSIEELMPDGYFDKYK